MAGNASGIGGSVILIATILAWSVGLDAIAYRFPAVAPRLKARARPLVVDSRVNKRSLRREFMKEDELMAEVRLHGITKLSQVARAYLEPNGMISVIRVDRNEPEEPRKPVATQ